MFRRLWLILGFLVLVPCLAYGGAIVRSASGSSPAAISGAVDQFRADLGVPTTASAGLSHPGTGRSTGTAFRMPLSAPNTLPANFSTPTPRAAVFDARRGLSGQRQDGQPERDRPSVREPEPELPFDFQTFSPERLFVAPSGATSPTSPSSCRARARPPSSTGSASSSRTWISGRPRRSSSSIRTAARSAPTRCRPSFPGPRTCRSWAFPSTPGRRWRACGSRAATLRRGLPMTPPRTWTSSRWTTSSTASRSLFSRMRQRLEYPLPGRAVQGSATFRRRS